MILYILKMPIKYHKKGKSRDFSHDASFTCILGFFFNEKMLDVVQDESLSIKLNLLGNYVKANI